MTAVATTMGKAVGGNSLAAHSDREPTDQTALDVATVATCGIAARSCLNINLFISSASSRVPVVEGGALRLRQIGSTYHQMRVALGIWTNKGPNHHNKDAADGAAGLLLAGPRKPTFQFPAANIPSDVWMPVFVFAPRSGRSVPTEAHARVHRQRHHINECFYWMF